MWQASHLHIHADFLGLFTALSYHDQLAPRQMPTSGLTWANSPSCSVRPLTTFHFSKQLCGMRNQSNSSFSGTSFDDWCFWTVVLEKTLESPLDCKEIKPVHPKGNQSWIFIGRTDAEAEALILWPPDAKSWLIWKDPVSGKDWRQEEKVMTEDKMVGWHHWLDGHEFEQAWGDGDGQGSLACCSPWGRKESDTTEWLNGTEQPWFIFWRLWICSQFCWMSSSLIWSSLIPLYDSKEEKQPVDKPMSPCSSQKSWSFRFNSTSPSSEFSQAHGKSFSHGDNYIAFLIFPALGHHLTMTPSNMLEQFRIKITHFYLPKWDNYQY